MRPRSLRPLEKGLIAYVVALALLLTLTFGVNALVARPTATHVVTTEHPAVVTDAGSLESSVTLNPV